MNITFTKQAWEDYVYWQKNDIKMLKRINLLIKDIVRSPHEGFGKPEALRHNLSEYWSRRINEEHRIIYKQFESGITFVQLRYHYT